MRRLNASRAGKAGFDPTNAPAGNSAVRLMENGAAACMRRRPAILSSAFWLCSAEGAILLPHEARSCHIARIAADLDRRTGHDLRARGEGRQQDLFGSSAARRPSPWRCSRRRPIRRRPLRRRPIHRRRANSSEVMDAANFQYQCAISPRPDETLQNPEAVTLSVQLTPGLRPGDQVNFSLDGTDVPNEQNGTSTISAISRSRLAYGERACHGPLREDAVRYQRDLPRAAHRPEFADAQGAPPRPTPFRGPRRTRVRHSADARAMQGRRPAWLLNASFLPRSRTSSPPT